MFVVTGFLIVFSAFLPSPANGYAMLILIGLYLVLTLGYSFFLFQKEQKG